MQAVNIESAQDVRKPNNDITDDDVKKLGMGMGSIVCCVALVVGILNLAFIIPSLIYAYQGTACVTTIPEGFSFNLSTWLQVDSYIRLAIIGALFIIAIISCISTFAGIALLTCILIIIIIYSLFQFAWLIVGAVLFWNKLNPTGICTGGVHDYMYAMLIISFIGICCNCLGSGGLKKNDQI